MQASALLVYVSLYYHIQLEGKKNFALQNLHLSAVLPVQVNTALIINDKVASIQPSKDEN